MPNRLSTSTKNADVLIGKLKNISSGGIQSFEYIHRIVEFINAEGKNVKTSLNSILETEFSYAEHKVSKEVLFTAYYALAFYYKRYDKIEKLGELIRKYRGRFSNAVLCDEISSWYYRRIGDLEMALACDKRLISAISIHENAGPYISYASSVSKMLEKNLGNNLSAGNLQYWTSIKDVIIDWELAIRAIKGAIEEYQIIRPDSYYGKHYFIYGKLLAFEPQITKKSIEEVNRIYDEAIKCFEKAIEYENENEEDYFKRYEEYRQYENKCIIMKLEIIGQIKNQQISDKICEMDKLEEDMRKMPEKFIVQSMEIIAVFSAILAIIMGGLNIAISMSIMDSIFLIMVFTCACAFLICILTILLFDGKKRNKAIIISMLILLLIAFITIYRVISG